jgi:uncharacterized protein YjiS (DUF1127 family)
MAQLQHLRQVGRPAAWFDRLDGVTAGAGLPQAIRLPLIWLRRLRNRHELSRLDEAQLRDVGLSPAAARREIAKPFWRD